MRVEIFNETEKIFESQITRYSIMESRMAIDLVGGFIDTTLQNSKLYKLKVFGTDEVIEKYSEFLSYNYNVQSTFAFNPDTGQLILDENGNKIIEYRRGENSLLFKLF